MPARRRPARASAKCSATNEPTFCPVLRQMSRHFATNEPTFCVFFCDKMSAISGGKCGLAAGVLVRKMRGGLAFKFSLIVKITLDFPPWRDCVRLAARPPRAVRPWIARREPFGVAEIKTPAEMRAVFNALQCATK